MLFIHDQLIIQLFFNENDKLNRNYRLFINRIKKSKYNNIQTYLLNRYNDLTIGSKTIIKESLYRILWQVDKRVQCPVCQKYTGFNPSKKTCYNDHCSRSCEMKDKHVMDKHNKSCLEKYGSVNNIQKCKKTKLEKYGDENYNNITKRNNTNLKKYGNICVLQNKEVKEKTEQTNLKRYGFKIAQKNQIIRNKIKQSNINTCNNKYGVNNIMQVNDIYEKQKQTFLLKFGTDNFYTSEYYKQNYKTFVEKANNTKRKNNTFNTSNPEDQCFELLKEKYPDVIRQYKSPVYPFNCDFYIPSLDLYIEYNEFWTHGQHPYNPNNIEDQQKLQKWKSKNTKFYKNAIYTWTVSDIKKRNIAKENKLNYIEFWNFDEFDIFLNKR